jgi:hypothetical protein
MVLYYVVNNNYNNIIHDILTIKTIVLVYDLSVVVIYNTQHTVGHKMLTIYWHSDIYIYIYMYILVLK